MIACNLHIICMSQLHHGGIAYIICISFACGKPGGEWRHPKQDWNLHHRHGSQSLQQAFLRHGAESEVHGELPYRAGPRPSLQHGVPDTLSLFFLLFCLDSSSNSYFSGCRSSLHQRVPKTLSRNFNLYQILHRICWPLPISR